MMLTLYFPPAKAYGGPIVSAFRLAAELGRQGDRVRVVTTDADGGRRSGTPRGWVEAAPNVEVFYCRSVGGRLFAPGMLGVALRELARCDVVYVWGLFVWMLPALIVAARIRRTPMVVSARGMLSREALWQKSARKRAFLFALRLAGFERTAVVHATSEMEREQVMRCFPNARVFVVPNGVDLPKDEAAAAAQAGQGPYFLYLGRLDRHKQVERIVEAFGRAASAPSDGAGWRLVIAGDGDSRYEDELKNMEQRLGLAGRVEHAGFVEGARKGELLRSSACVVLASKSENFGMSAAEGLASGVPVIATRGTPWQGLEERRCGWWVDDSVPSLEDAMRAAMSLSLPKRREMGRRGREWMAGELSWESVGARMHREMSGLAGGRPRT
jgi:glycosyltransferase involved in cell wall biosynthesis